MSITKSTSVPSPARVRRFEREIGNERQRPPERIYCVRRSCVLFSASRLEKEAPLRILNAIGSFPNARLTGWLRTRSPAGVGNAALRHRRSFRDPGSAGGRPSGPPKGRRRTKCHVPAPFLFSRSCSDRRSRAGSRDRSSGSGARDNSRQRFAMQVSQASVTLCVQDLGVERRPCRTR